MNKRYIVGAVLAAGTLLAGCSVNGLSQSPAVSQVNLQQVGKLEFAVGTANFGFDANAIGLNTVTSFRQTDGLSAVLVNTPAIAGPAGFTNTGDANNPDVAPNCQAGRLDAGADSGTSKISASPQNPNPINTPLPATFGQAGGAFSYGIEPLNSRTGGSAFYVGNPNGEDCNRGLNYPAYPTPFYLSTNSLAALKLSFGLLTPPVYLGGPPAYPFFKDPSYPSGFAGFSQGFDAFEMLPVAGQYTLSVNVAAANAPSASYSANATLNNLTPLPNMSAPTWTSDGAGGGGGTVTIPADSRIVETMVYVYDEKTGLYFSAGPLSGNATTLNYTIPDNLGPCTLAPGCQTTSPTVSMLPGDTIIVYAASYDYPMFEASPPNSKSQTPTITGAGGQADVTFSALTKGTE